MLLADTLQMLLFYLGELEEIVKELMCVSVPVIDDNFAFP